MVRMWKWLMQMAIARHRKAFLEATCVNLKCPHCNTWMSDSADQGSINSFGHEIAVRFDCGQCKKPSYWVCEAGFWFQAERFGITNPEMEGVSHE